MERRIIMSYTVELEKSVESDVDTRSRVQLDIDIHEKIEAWMEIQNRLERRMDDVGEPLTLDRPNDPMGQRLWDRNEEAFKAYHKEFDVWKKHYSDTWKQKADKFDLKGRTYEEAVIGWYAIHEPDSLKAYEENRRSENYEESRYNENYVIGEKL